jgi:hypothetical protein
MAACQEIKTLGDVESELTRVRDLVKISFASATSTDRDFPDIVSGLLWVVCDIENNVDRILAGLEKIKEARAGRV